MAGKDARSVGELLADADFLTRQVLLDVSGDQAPGLVRTWGEVVEAAAELWAAMPDPSPGAVTDPMVRLEAVAHGMHRTHLREGWPGHGPTDERLLTVAETFARATDLVQRHGHDVSPASPRVRADIEAARMRIMHTLYVGAHGVGVALHEHVRDLYHGAAAGLSGSPKREPSGVGRRQATIQRFAAFEQMAGDYIGGRYAEALRGEMTQPPVTHDRLHGALIGWDIAAHRTLATSRTGPNLLLVARTQALVATASAVILDAAAETGHIDAVPYRQRLALAIDASQEAWTHAASRWADLTHPGTRTDNKLVKAANELRAAVREVAHDTTTWAAPEVIAARVDLTDAAHSIQQALNAAVDVSHLISEIAATEPDLTGPARALSVRAHTEAEQAIQRGERADIDVVWVSPRDVHANRLVPLPGPVRQELLEGSDRTVQATTNAMAAASCLDRQPTKTKHELPEPNRPLGTVTEELVKTGAARIEAGPRR